MHEFKFLRVCGENKLTELDVSKNINLSDLGVSDNLLTNLDLSNNNLGAGVLKSTEQT